MSLKIKYLMFTIKESEYGYQINIPSTSKSLNFITKKEVGRYRRYY